MSEDGSTPQSTPGSDAELDLLSREKLMRDLTSKERARLLAFKQIVPLPRVVALLEADTRDKGPVAERDEDAADEDGNELEL